MAENSEYRPIAFAFAMQTDGAKVNFRFYKRSCGKIFHCSDTMYVLLMACEERYPSSIKEFNFLPRDCDMSHWARGRGVYHLKKQPTGMNQGLLQNADIVGVDPGIHMNILAYVLATYMLWLLNRNTGLVHCCKVNSWGRFGSWNLSWRYDGDALF